MTLLTFVTLLFGFQLKVEAQTTYQWRIAQTWSKDFPIYSDAVKRLSSMVNELSSGRLIIKIDGSEDHKKPLGVFDLVQSGEYQMAHSASYFWKDRDINTLFFTTLPSGMIAPEQYSWFYYGGGLELMQKAYKRYGILSFPGGNTGNQMGGWFSKEIRTLKDLQGLKMNIPGLAGDAIIKLGVQSVNLPASELYSALESKKIDAVEWVGPSQDLKMGFHKVAPFYYTGWHEPATELQFMVNSKAFNSLPKDLRNILTVSMRLVAYDMYYQSYHVSALNLKKLVSEYPDIKLRAFPRDVLRLLHKHATWKIDEIEEFGSDLTKEIIQSIRAYQKDARLWTRMSDQAFLNNALN